MTLNEMRAVGSTVAVVQEVTLDDIKRVGAWNANAELGKYDVKRSGL